MFHSRVTLYVHRAAASGQRRTFAAASRGAGIAAMEAYVPRRYVSQTDLEQFDGASAGKYVKGLGQTAMSFVDSSEDMSSLAMTAVERLLQTHNIDPKSIGRIEVGTETILDKSKSVKTSLMPMFAAAGNSSIEGIDTTNACYGGTSALFNAVQWLESPYWDGRNAIVVAGDIAVYDAGPARPTGGVGCVAMLVTPNAPLQLETPRGTYMEDAYDFYKPLADSEYPVVDGHLSNDCYIRSLDSCVKSYGQRFAADIGEEFSLDKFRYLAFHSPYSKLVQKSFARFYYHEFLRNPNAAQFAESGLQAFKDTPLHETYGSRDLSNVAVAESLELFNERVLPTLEFSKQTGNTYCGSLYFCLLATLARESADSLAGQRIGMFSYGSGLASSLFSLRATEDVAALAPALNTGDFAKRLNERTLSTPAEFTAALDERKAMHGAKSYTPPFNRDSFFPGTYRLVEIDELYRRKYEKVE